MVGVVAVVVRLVAVVEVVGPVVPVVLGVRVALVRLGVLPVVVAAGLPRSRPLSPCPPLLVLVAVVVWWSRPPFLPPLSRRLAPLVLLVLGAVVRPEAGLAVGELSGGLRCGAGRLPSR